MSLSMEDLRQFSVAERLKLIDGQSLCECPDEIPVTPAQRSELDRRLHAAEQDPNPGETWEQLKAFVRRRK